MNGVLAKPFTKEGMLKSVKTHMMHLLKNPPPQTDHTVDNPGFIMGGVPFFNGPQASIKFETPTPPPGASGPTWSPGPMAQNGMDQGYGLMNGGNQYGMGRPNYASTMDPNSARISDNDSPPEKRQRLNAHPPNYG